MSHPPRPRALLLALAVLAWTPAASAHERGLSRAEIRVHGGRIGVDLVFARPEIVELVPGADADRSGQLDEAELLSVETLLSDQVRQGVQIAAGDVACPGAVERISFVEEDGLAVAAAFTCPTGDGPLPAFTVRLPLLARLVAGHRLVGHVVFQDMSSETALRELDFVAHRRRSALTIRRPEPDRAGPPSSAAAPALAPAPVRAPVNRWSWLLLAVGALGLVLLGHRRYDRRRDRP